MRSAKRSKNVGGTSVSRQSKSRRQVRSHVQGKSGSDRPFVFATFAMTVDGKITTRTFAPVDFTSREDKAHLFRQRARADAVLIGHSTLKRDNVRLGLPAGARGARSGRGPAPRPPRGGGSTPH